MSLAQAGNVMGSAIAGAAQYTAKAAARANGVSDMAQRKQGDFNKSQVELANNITADRIAQQYGFNSGQAAAANNFTSNMWDQAASYNTEMWQTTADWNERMWQKMADFNAQEAQKNRDWQEEMMKTAYQRAVKDMEAAGLNPILAVTGGGISTGSGAGSAASVGSTSMSPASMGGASGYAASGGLPNALAASEGNYTGQMEYMGGWLGLLSAAISGISTAMSAMGGMGKFGEQLGQAIGTIFNTADQKRQNTADNINSIIPKAIQGTENNYRNGVKWQTYKSGGSSGTFKNTSKGGSSGKW